MTAAQRAMAVVEKAQSKYNLPIDHIYCFNWPPNDDLDANKTDVLITEVNDLPTDYGSNQSNMMQETVALNIFYAADSDIDFDKFEQPLLNVFENQGWFCNYSPGHTIDPDTLQTTKVFRFRHKMRKDEI